MRDLEYSSYTESPVQVECVRSSGACLWVTLGLIGFFVFISYIPISGVTEAPAYAKALLYMSLSHQFTDVQDAMGSISPPPPSFRM